MGLPHICLSMIPRFSRLFMPNTKSKKKLKHLLQNMSVSRWRSGITGNLQMVATDLWRFFFSFFFSFWLSWWSLFKAWRHFGRFAVARDFECCCFLHRRQSLWIFIRSTIFTGKRCGECKSNVKGKFRAWLSVRHFLWYVNETSFLYWAKLQTKSYENKRWTFISKIYYNITRLSARVSFLDTEMKIQIRAPNKLTNKVTALCMKVAARWRMKLAEMHILFRRILLIIAKLDGDL